MDDEPDEGLYGVKGWLAPTFPSREENGDEDIRGQSPPYHIPHCIPSVVERARSCLASCLSHVAVAGVKSRSGFRQP